MGRIEKNSKIKLERKREREVSNLKERRGRKG